MGIRTTVAALALGALACATDGGSASSEQPVEDLSVPEAFTPVVASVVGSHTVPVAGSDGRTHVVYELLLTNAKAVPATIERIEILDFDRPSVSIDTLSGTSLTEASFQLSARPAEDEVLEANESMLIYVSLAFDDPAQVPARLVHRLSGTGASGPGAQEPTPLSYLVAPLALTGFTPPVIGPPLRGSGWLVANGCCAPRAAHRGSIQSVNGALWDSQRFAIDWLQLGDDGRLLAGDPDQVESWNAYGEPVLAVAAGTVVAVLDGLDDQVPGTLPDPNTITLETVDGNHVILNLGEGVFVLYAHLKKGSILVREGERVAAGAQLGSLGNSGNSSAPHLHLQLMDRPSSVAADGLPFVFDAFEMEGAIDADVWYGSDEITGAFSVVEEDPPGEHERQLPLDLRILSFPQARASE